MTPEEFLKTGGEIEIALISPTGERNTHTLKPVRHSRGSCGWKLKDGREWTLPNGDRFAVTIAATVVIEKSGQWSPGETKRRWSKAVAEQYQKTYGQLPDNVEVESQ